LISILTLCAAAPVAAQTVTIYRHDSIAEVGLGGFMQSAVDGPQPPSPEFGGAMLASIYPTEIVGIAGELAAFDDSQTGGGRAALAGVKLRTSLISSGRTHWRLFGQVLGGPQWTGGATRHRVLQPAVGAEDYLKNGLTLHVEYAYTFAPSSARDLSTGRFLVGVAMPLGTRD